MTRRRYVVQVPDDEYEALEQAHESARRARAGRAAAAAAARRAQRATLAAKTEALTAEAERLKRQRGMSERAIARHLGISRKRVPKLLGRTR